MSTSSTSVLVVTGSRKRSLCSLDTRHVDSLDCVRRCDLFISQVPFAAELKKALPNMAIGTVGAITEPEQAESYLQEGKADVVLMAREFLRNPSWPLYAAQKLGVTLKAANQFEMAWPAPSSASKLQA